MDRLGDAAFLEMIGTPGETHSAWRHLIGPAPLGVLAAVCLRRSCSRSMNYPVASAASRDAMITPMLTST